MLPLSKEKSDNVKSLLEKRCSYNEISKKCKVSKTYISKIKSKYFPQLSYSITGRNKVLTDKNMSYCVHYMTSGKIKTFTKLKKI